MAAKAMAATEDLRVSALLLVRNSVDHDARVLRAARVAGRELAGTPLVVGVATAAGLEGARMMEGIWVVRFAPRKPSLAHVRRAVRPAGLRRVRGLLSKHQGSESGNERGLGIATSSSDPRLTAAARARRTLSGLSFALQALLLARWVKPSVVHANDWNTMWCALAIKLTCGSRLVYDSHELWADRNRRWEWRPWLLASEALFVRVADEVVTSSPGYADALAARYRIPRPEVVRNIPEHRLADRNSSSNEPRHGAAVPHRVVYIGGLMPGRGLEQMIDALAFAPEVRLRAVGPGAEGYRRSLLARARSVGVEERIELCAPVSPAQVPDALVGAAAGLCLIQPICRSYELCLPNKLFEYAAAGVPILASDVPVIAEVVRCDGLGEVVAAGDPRAIARGLTRLCAPDAWSLASERIRVFAAAHTWEREANVLGGLYTHARTRQASRGLTARQLDAGNGRPADSPVVHSSRYGGQ